MGHKASNSQIQEMFREGNLIARALYISSNISNTNDKLGYDLTTFNEELSFLESMKPNEGIHKNVARDGTRNRSATLLAPNVEMNLFHDIGFLYDADKSTVRGYMFHDAVTTSGGAHDEFYNINADKSKEEQLKEVINTRLEKDGLPKIANLKTTIISKEDIKNLVSTLDREIALKDKTHRPMDHKKLDLFVSNIMEEVINRRDNNQKRNSIQENQIRKSYTKNIISNRIKEFFYKVASLFNEKPITQKINRSI